MSVLKLRHAFAYTTMVALKAAEVAAKLANLSAPNTYIDALQQGVPVGIDAEGNAVVADGATPGSVLGLCVTGAMDNQMANLGQLANKQITIVRGPTLIETDNLVAAVEYIPGDKLYAGTGANLGKLTKTQPSNGERALAVITQGRAAAGTGTVWAETL